MTKVSARVQCLVATVCVVQTMARLLMTQICSASVPATSELCSTSTLFTESRLLAPAPSKSRTVT